MVDGIVAVDVTQSIDVARNDTATLYIIDVVSSFITVDVTQSIDVARNDTATLYIIDVSSMYTVTRNNNVAHNKNATTSISFARNNNTDATFRRTDVGRNDNTSYIVTNHNNSTNSIILGNKITDCHTSMIIYTAYNLSNQ